jgi:hypothetical protein
MHGSTTLQGSAPPVPVFTRAISNEIAICMMWLQLTGLCGAVHLNGRKGVVAPLRDQVAPLPDRWRVRLNDSTQSCRCEGYELRAGASWRIQALAYRRECIVQIYGRVLDLLSPITTPTC